MSRGAWASVFGESCVAIARSGVTGRHLQFSIQKLLKHSAVSVSRGRSAALEHWTFYYYSSSRIFPTLDSNCVSSVPATGVGSQL